MSLLLRKTLSRGAAGVPDTRFLMRMRILFLRSIFVIAIFVLSLSPGFCRVSFVDRQIN
jgi:hypothetical protein